MKKKTYYSCTACAYQSPKWLGRCPDCSAWNSFVEETVLPVSSRHARAQDTSYTRSSPQAISDVPLSAGVRLNCGINEFNRVLGGGLVPGSLVLIGGDPGIGKSTLLLQVMHQLAPYGTILYVSGEESAAQTRLRGERLGIQDSSLMVLAENHLEQILEHCNQLQPQALVIDSIQTIWTGALESAPGSVSQVRETAGRLMSYAKQSGVPTILVGHVTKDGALAGPRVLEHMVDTVLYFEGDRGHPYRILRAVKNRFGSTNEIGVFEMKAEGLDEVLNPSELFLAERPLDTPGSVVTATIEGSRTVLLEIQALVTPSAYGTPRRTTLGVDQSRVALLLAVLEKKAGLHLSGQDVFVNVAGGAKLSEPAADLPILLAIASSYLDKPIPSDMVVVGEVGLAGEIRAVTQPELRLSEAAKLGFSQCVVPEGNRQRLEGTLGSVRFASHVLAVLPEVL